MYLMRYSVIILVFIALLPVSAHAGDTWKKEDTYRQLVLTGLCIIDIAQTKRGLEQGYVESNPLLGNHPTDNELNLRVGIGVLLHTGIAYILPKKYRTPFQYISIGNRSTAVLRHYQMGIEINF